MKILIDARMYGLENTGIGRYLINLINELQRIDKENNYIILLRKTYFDSLNLAKNWKKVIAEFRHYTLEEQIRLPWIINNENPDIVHFPHFNIPIFWNGKFVVTIHDMSMHKQGIDATKLPLPLYTLKRIPYKIAFSKAVKKSKIVITPTKHVKKEITNYFDVVPDKISVVYEGINNTFFKPSTAEILSKYNIKNLYFIYAGNVYPHKNVDLLISAILKLNDNSAGPVKLLIVCPRNVFSDELALKVRNQKASDLVKISGFVEDKDLAALYKFSEGFIYPSFSEGFGLQGLETMAAGSVVLASNIDVFKEVYGDHAFYFDPFEVNSLVLSMKYVMGLNSRKRDNLIGKSRNFIKKYSWRKMAQQTLDIYKKAAE